MRRGVLVLTAMLFALGTTGTNLGPALVDERPRLVLLLSSRNRNLFGAAPYVDATAFFAVGFVRILVAAVALYLVGRWYGERTVRWVEETVGETPAIYRWVERAVDKAGGLAVVLMPGSNVVCVLLGHRKLSFAKYLPCLVVGIIIKLIVLRIGGNIFEDQVRWFLKSIERYQWWVVIALFGISALQARKRRPLDPPANDEAPETR
ncbi:MAG: VTT domain-containing protein [Actinomycetota bacterium]